MNLKLFFSNYYIKRHCSLPIIDFENHIGLGVIYLDADILQIFGFPVIAAFYYIFPECEFPQNIIVLGYPENQGRVILPRYVDAAHPVPVRHRRVFESAADYLSRAIISARIAHDCKRVRIVAPGFEIYSDLAVGLVQSGCKVHCLRIGIKYFRLQIKLGELLSPSDRKTGTVMYAVRPAAEDASGAWF